MQSQTNWIAAFLILGFVVFVNSKQQIPQYRAIVGV